MRISVVIIALLLLAGTAQAQVNPWRNNRTAPRLTEADTALMHQAAQKLLDAPNPPVGRIEHWSNAETGAAGTVTFRGPRSHTAQGQNFACRHLEYTTTVHGRSGERSAEVDWCRTKDGSWKLF
ncbi:17kDa_Anti_2 domain-containing protein [Rhodovastum atsumiense]|uniref:Uncharacterized protein n=1 Tax=Rhodovastum atsumiense TaxID=504468 RepID=A0A5M6ILQ0_9PROT|nr:RT0821/Lpp0805 family surface protein [Rhodovastum atsumiense]KAA5609203.1 hypothetical protein F1189_25235 [Rhodovastum atsumiense]CAH2603970.1 17kDa_Anti_2 domain-containing protein [Rhodovastum atsumiense]